ncbi:nuclear transport factor 2 family protein [Streptomyces xanthophaeus]
MTVAEQVASEFIRHYYSVFDTNRPGLVSLYRDESLLSFEGKEARGAQDIVEMLGELSFPSVRHIISTTDVQPSVSGSNGLVIVVTGQFVIDGEDRPMNFVEMFHLVPNDGSFWVLNDIFRIMR